MTAEADAAAGGMHASKAKEKKMSKRQKRKQVNETNKWPQHPKIQDMNVRNKAYIRVAGFSGSSSPSKNAKALMDPKLDLMSPEVKFGRLLGSTDQRKRHAAVQKLKAYLKARCDIHNETGGISEMDLLKLWKGLWYTLYMADKVPVQDELSKHLAQLLWCVAGTEEEDEYAGRAYMEICGMVEGESEEGIDEEEGDNDDEDSDDPDVTLEEVVNTLEDDSGSDSSEKSDGGSAASDDVSNEDEKANEEELEDTEVRHCRGAHLASLFIRTFFRTVKREWGNMDKYRVDKFYTLARLYMREIFKYMSLRHWNLGIMRLFNDAIFEEVLTQRPNGLRYHLIDLALDELAKINAEAPMPLTEATFLDAMEPYFAMAQTGAGGDNSVQRRVIENVLEKFLEKYSVVSAATGNDDEDAKKLIFDQVHVGTISQFIFELGSDQETMDQYRKSLYDTHKSYERQLKKVGNDVVLNSEIDDDDMEDMETMDVDQQLELVEEHQQAIDKAADSKEDIEPPADDGAAAKKKKKKRNRHSDQEDETDAHDIGSNVEEAQIPKTKKRKRNKKKKDEAPSASSAPTANDEDEVVTISLGDQKKAKAVQKKKGKKKREEPESETPPGSADKRVKWLPSNKSKSYKASIKGLRTASVPNTSKVTPEKSILLNKEKVRRVGITKAGRKKAAHYF